MADDLFTSRLLSGERILWSGKPGQGLLLTERDNRIVWGVNDRTQTLEEPG
jgi:hypothetical protein